MTTAPIDAEDRPVESIVARLDAAAGQDRTTLGDLVAAFGRQSFLPLLIAPGLLLVSPLSGVPFFSSVCGLIIALTALQMLWPGRRHVWLPARLMRLDVSGERARRAASRLTPLARWLDRRAAARGSFLVAHRPGRTVLIVACTIAGLMLPGFELVPFTSSMAGLGVVLVATGLTTRDGLFAALGLAVIVAAPALPLLTLQAIAD